jgi:hypothetical protein
VHKQFSEACKADAAVLFRQLIDEKKLCGHSQQDSATAHTTEHVTQTLNIVFDESIINYSLWPPHSPDVTPYDFL